MKTSIFALTLSLLLTSLPAPLMAQEEIAASEESAAVTVKPVIEQYFLDIEHSKISFKVKHLGFSDVSGQFRGFGGVIYFSPNSPNLNRVETSIQTKTIDTGVPKRDKHLASTDFLNTQKFREIRFVSTEVIGDVKGSFVVKGLLTLHGTSLPIELNAQYLGEVTDPWGFERIAFKATTSLNRKDYGITWSKVLDNGSLIVGEDVLIELDIQAVKKKEPVI